MDNSGGQTLIAQIRSFRLRDLIDKRTYGTALFAVLTSLLFGFGVLSTTFASLFKLNPIGLTDFQFWTIVTGGFYEENVLKFLLLGSLTVILSLQVEKVWGWQNYVPYIFFVNALSGLVASAFEVMLYYWVDEEHLFEDMYGLGGVLSCILIALGQIDPDLRILGAVGITSRLLPLSFLILYSLLYWAGLPIRDHSLAVLSSIFAIIYLQRRPMEENGVGVTLDLFCPSPLRPFVLALSILMFRKRQQQAQYQVSPLKPLKPVMSDPVSERRRARALKALDKKLAEISSEPEVSFDDSAISEA